MTDKANISPDTNIASGEKREKKHDKDVVPTQARPMRSLDLHFSHSLLGDYWTFYNTFLVLF